MLPHFLQRRILSVISRLPLHKRPPRFMAIEPTNNCNLHCPLCPVGAKTMDRRRGFMDLEKYKSLIDEIAPHTSQILMNFAGEPLLHPNIGEMVSYAEQKGIKITLGTHGNIDKMQELIDAGTSEILFALDGTTEETYQQYRVGGSMETALGNLKKLVVARDQKQGCSTRIILQFVVMRHNSHEVEEVIKIAKDFGVDTVSLQPVCVNDFFPEDQDSLVAQWVPDDSPYLLHPEVTNGGGPSRHPLCVWAIQSVVLYNGDVTICCFDTNGSHVVGNAFNSGGFAAVWESPEYRIMRQHVVQQALPICEKCDIGLVKATRISTS